jgi:hypothetical protein
MFDFYIYREQTTEERKNGDVVVRKVYIGPFASEAKAVQVEKALKVFNKTKCGRGMNTKVHKTDGVADKSADCWNVMYGDTVTSKYEKDTSYDWVVDFLASACTKSGVFAGSSVRKFTTNISSLQASIGEYREAKTETKTEAKTEPKAAPVVPVKESKKAGRLSADEIKKRLDDKKSNKQALKDAKEVKKAVSKLIPAQQEEVKAQAQAKAARRNFTQMHLGSEQEVY